MLHIIRSLGVQIQYRKSFYIMDYLSEKQTLYEEEDRILMHKDGTETDILFVCFI